MKKFLLTLLCCFAFIGVANAQVTLTVNDGTVTNTYVPVYGFNADNYQRAQFVQPAEDLAPATGGVITGLKFFANNASVNWTGTFQVYLTEVAEPTISTFIETSSATVVYEGTMAVADNEMVVTLATPFFYNGGNLLIGFDETVKGNYSSCAFIGVTSTGSSVSGYNGSSLAEVSANQRDFLPKMEISYTPGGDWHPTPVTSITASDVTVATNHSVQIVWSVLPEDATYKAVTFASADPSIATVSDKGLVRGMSAGQTTVTITSEKNPEVSTTINVTVEQGSDVLIGEGNVSNNHVPSYAYYKYSLGEQIFTAQELNVPGGCLITGLTLYYSGDRTTERTVDIYLKNTNKASFEHTNDFVDLVASDKVFSGRVKYTPGVTEVVITLDTPFEYDGTSNILFGWDDNTNSYSGGLNFKCDDVARMSIGAYDDYADIDPSDMESCISSKELPGVRNMVLFTYESLDKSAVKLSVNVPESVNLGQEFSAAAALALPRDADSYQGFTHLVLDINYDATAFELTGNYTPGEILAGATCSQVAYPEAAQPHVTVTIDSETPITAAGDLFTVGLLSKAGGSYPFTLAVADATDFTCSGTPVAYKLSGESVLVNLPKTIILVNNGVADTLSVFEPLVLPDVDVPRSDFEFVGWYNRSLGYVESPFLPNNLLPVTLYAIFRNETGYSNRVYNVDTEINSLTIASWEHHMVLSGVTLKADNIANSDGTTLVVEEGGYLDFGNTESDVYAVLHKHYDGCGEGDGNRYLISSPLQYFSAGVLRAPNDDKDIVYQEGFESGLGQWTTIDADGDGYTWIQSSVLMSGYSVTPHSGSDMMSSASYFERALHPDNYLVSPKLTIPANAKFGFWATAQDLSYGEEHFGVAVSTASNTLASDFTTLDEWTYEAPEGTDTYNFYEVDLSAYAGQEVYIAIRHFNCTDQFYLNVDDAMLYTPKEVVSSSYFLDVYNNQAAAGSEWVSDLDNPISVLEYGKGYRYAVKQDKVLDIESVVLNPQTDYEFPAVYNAANPFYLAGNPYSAKAYVDHDYFAMNAAGNEVILRSGAIEPWEGFFIALANADDVAKVSKNDISPELVGLDITLGQNRDGAVDRAIVRIGDGEATPKFLLDESHTNINFPQGGTNNAVVYTQPEGELPMNFQPANDGSYVLNVEVKNINLDYLHLIDKVTGDDVDLLTVPGYSFSATANDGVDRFTLVFEDPLTGVSKLTNGKEVANVRYYNAAGQQMPNAEGVTIVVTTYTDGTTSTAKVVK